MWARISLALNCLAKVRPYVTAFFDGSEKSTGTRIFLIEIICASIAFFAHRLPSGNLHKAKTQTRWERAIGWPVTCTINGRTGEMNARETTRLQKPKFNREQRVEGRVEGGVWHEHSIAKTLELFNTSKSGVDAEEVLRRLSVQGPNTLDFKKHRSPIRMLLGQFTDFMILVLIAAAVLSGIIGDLKDTIVIAAIVLLNGIIGFTQEFRAERALEALQEMGAPTANVIRSGQSENVPGGEVVPGDIVLLEAGGIVPADLRLIECVQLRIEEAALTGESHPVEKITTPLPDSDLPLGDRRNMAYMGTVVTNGRGRGVIVATGTETEFGQVATMLHLTEEVTTPL